MKLGKFFYLLFVVVMLVIGFFVSEVSVADTKQNSSEENLEELKNK